MNVQNYAASNNGPATAEPTTHASSSTREAPPPPVVYLRNTLTAASVKAFFDSLKRNHHHDNEHVQWKRLVSDQNIAVISTFLGTPFDAWSSLPVDFLYHLLKPMTDASTINMTILKLVALPLEYEWDNAAAIDDYVRRFAAYTELLTQAALHSANLTVHQLIQRIIHNMATKAEEAQYAPYQLLVDHLQRQPDRFTTFDSFLSCLLSFHQDTEKTLTYALRAGMRPPAPPTYNRRHESGAVTTTHDSDNDTDEEAAAGVPQQRQKQQQRTFSGPQDKQASKDRRPSNGPEPKRARPNATPPMCNGCGRHHTGQCRLRDHPNFNHHSWLPWKQCPFGMAFASLGHAVLPPHMDINGYPV